MRDSARASYEKPTVTYWPAEELNSIEAKMSGGGGGSPISYKVHILFSAIRVDNLALPFDHAALFVSCSGTDYGYFYGYIANPAAGVGLISGTDGYLATACTSGGAQRQIYYSGITSTGTVLAKLLDGNEPKVDDDKGYYRAINFAVTRDSALALRDYANGMLGWHGTYKLLWSNCYDKAQEILATQGISIEYDWGGTVAFVTAAVSAVALVSPLLAGALATSLAAGTLDAGHLNIPNQVYDGFVRAQRNGSTLPSSGKSAFRSR